MKGTTRSTMMVALTLFCFAVAEANATYIDGDILFEQCKDYKPGTWKWFSGACVGYVLGAGDAFDETTKPFCVTEGPNPDIVSEMVEIVKLYLRDHPETRHSSASSLVAAALKEKFPCN
jgi:Rap1a immunity proteins